MEKKQTAVLKRMSQSRWLSYKEDSAQQKYV